MFVFHTTEGSTILTISPRSNISLPMPDSHATPPFPSLGLWGTDIENDGYYLYYITDVWRFTLFWTLIVYGLFYLAASSYAYVLQGKNWKSMWVVSVAYLVVAGLEAVLAGSIVGLMYVGRQAKGIAILKAID